MPDEDYSEKCKLERFKILKDLHNAEQGFYWQRFTAFVGLNAGILIIVAVLLRDDFSPWAANVVVIIAALLALLWGWVQYRSWRYIQQWKKQYHESKEENQFVPDGKKLNEAWSSTKIALFVPVLVLALWIFVACFVWERPAATAPGPDTPEVGTAGSQ